MTAVIFALVLLILVLACGLVLQARLFHQREDKWREREMALVDRLLKQGHVQPVTIEREKVVRLPDAEAPTETWIDQAFFEDDVKEELEQIYPEVARMSLSDAKTRYAHDWRRVQERLRAERAPIRVD